MIGRAKASAHKISQWRHLYCFEVTRDSNPRRPGLVFEEYQEPKQGYIERNRDIIADAFLEEASQAFADSDDHDYFLDRVCDAIDTIIATTQFRDQLHPPSSDIIHNNNRRAAARAELFKALLDMTSYTVYVASRSADRPEKKRRM